MEGKMVTGEIAECFYFEPLGSQKYLGNLLGSIIDGVYQCHFKDGAGNEGDFELEFLKNDRIKGTIRYDHKEEYYEDTQMDGTYLFRPYNISDWEYVIIDKDKSFEVNLDSWGDVHFVVGVMAINKSYPVAFLTNEQNDILFNFGAPYQNASEIREVVIDDMNGDGLKDVKIVTHFPFETDEGEPWHWDWMFYQLQGGLFYLETDKE